MEEKMLGPQSIRYQAELATLVELVKSNTYEGNHVIDVLKTGDEEAIRHMLRNFGNPDVAEFADIKTASPWADWQIDQAVEDLNMIKPEDEENFPKSFAAGGVATGKFWAW
jgi:hypothetical protein